MRGRLRSLLCGAALLLPGWASAVEVNRASEADLDGVRGLGPATTRQILAEREKSPFKDWQDLRRRVQGIGVVSARQLSAQGLTVNGQAFPEPAARARQAPGS